MSVSNFFYQTTSFSPTIYTLPQFRKSHQENHFDGQNIIIQNSHESLVRVSTLIKDLASNLNTPKGSKSPLQALLEGTLYLPATEENKPLFAEITQAFSKQQGYLSRLFSNESWEEWSENRTALGKVASQFRNCIENRAEVCSFTNEMTSQLIQKANEESRVLLKGLGSREVTRTATSSCLYGLTGGIAGSFLFKNPLPVLMGISKCFPRAYAQQKVGNEFQVNTWTSGRQIGPSVASFSNGNFVVTWSSNGQDIYYGSFGQLFDGNGTKIGNEFRAHSNTIGNEQSPSVASFSNGNFVVTRDSQYLDGSFYGVYCLLFNGTGSQIGNEFQANTYSLVNQRSNSVASFSNGNFVVTWNSAVQDGDREGIFGQLFRGSGTKTGREFQVNTYTNGSQSSSAVTSLSNGNFVVTWNSFGQNGSTGVYGQLFIGNGAKFGSEFRANTYTTNWQRFPSVASFSNGNFVVTWESYGQDGSRHGVYGQLFDGNGAKIGNEFQVNTYTTNHQWRPSVASFSNDNFVVTWGSDGQDGDNWGIYGQLFDGNGAKIGNEFQVNTYTNNSQSSCSVASFSNGNFVVTWSSDGQDGSDFGVYGQIFHDNITYPSSSPTNTTPSFSNSTMSARTSVNPSNSGIVPSTPRVISQGNRMTKFLDMM